MGLVRGSGFDVRGSIVGHFFFGNILGAVHSFVGHAEQMPKLFAVLRNQCDTYAGRALNLLPLDDLGL